MAKLNKEQWNELLAKVKNGDQSVAELAKVYGISPTSIYKKIESVNPPKFKTTLSPLF